MKKSIALLLSIILCLGLLGSLSACSAENFDGTYYFYMNEQYYKNQFYTLKDGKWSNNQNMSGTYQVDDGVITLYMTSNNHTAVLHEGIIGDGQIVLDVAGYKMTYRLENIQE